MHLPVLSRSTAATVELLPALARDGGQTWVVVMKQRFAVGDRGGLRRVPGAAVMKVDELWDPDGHASSVRLPSDACPGKPGADVVVVGSALAPNRAPVRELDVLVRVGELRRTLHVTGLRVWYRTMAGLGLTPPEPFREVPLRWEYAWGGCDLGDPGRALMERRNPVGRGVASDPGKLVHQPGPQIEAAGDPITKPSSRLVPAGVGAVAPHWEPRLGFAGTMDERWEKERMPLLPLDFDERHYLVAAPGLSTPKPFVGGEPVQLHGMSERGPLTFALPRLAFGVEAVGRRERTHYRPALDTVVLFPGERAVELTWRAAVRAVGHEPRDILVFEKEA
ncbi:MAG TPA: DUF2169 domain-containing protein [Anaeromyxobacteraceae bacterium]|nr:DUF2169 domain-containing protein [Anaeromyxobacteraceae bacterium]